MREQIVVWAPLLVHRAFWMMGEVEMGRKKKKKWVLKVGWKIPEAGSQSSLVWEVENRKKTGEESLCEECSQEIAGRKFECGGVWERHRKEELERKGGLPEVVVMEQWVHSVGHVGREPERGKDWQAGPAWAPMEKVAPPGTCLVLRGEVCEGW